MKIAFFASDEIALEAIKYLHSAQCRHELICIVSNPDKPKGRGQKLSPNPISLWAIENSIPLLRPEKKPSSAEIDFMKSVNVDCILVMAYGHILGKDILDYPKYGCINLHASILPKYRGASPIESSIALRDTQTGLSLMKIAPKMDSGDVCAKIFVDIDSRETSHSLRVKIATATVKILEENLSDIENFSAKFIPQEESSASYVRKLDKSDLFLDFRKTAVELDARIRAFGCGIFEHNLQQIKIGEAFAEHCDEKNEHCGEVLLDEDLTHVSVRCASGRLKITMLQKPCAKMMSAKDFLRGYVIKNGEILKSFTNNKLLR